MPRESSSGQVSQWGRDGFGDTGAVASYSATLWGIPGSIIQPSNASVSLAGEGNRAFYFLLIVQSPITLNAAQIGVNVISSAGGLARISLYNSNRFWQPTSLIADFGEVARDSLGEKTITGLNTKLEPGIYLARVHLNDVATMGNLIFVYAMPVSGGFVNGLNSVNATTYPRKNIGSYGPAEASPANWDTVSTVVGGSSWTNVAFRSLVMFQWT